MSTPVRHTDDLDASAEDGAALKEAFHVLADQRLVQIRATGYTVAWDEAKTYLRGRANGHQASIPAARKSGA